MSMLIYLMINCQQNVRHVYMQIDIIVVINLIHNHNVKNLSIVQLSVDDQRRFNEIVVVQKIVEI